MIDMRLPFGELRPAPVRQTANSGLLSQNICLPNGKLRHQRVKKINFLSNPGWHWLAVEGVQKAGPNSQTAQGKTNGKLHKPISEDLLVYYDNMTKAILSNEEELIKVCYFYFIWIFTR